MYLRNKIWWIDYYAQGKRVRESVGPSKSLAKEVLRKRKYEVAEGKFFPNRKASNAIFQVVADKYWEMHGQYLKSSTWKNMLREALARFGSKPMGAISAADIQAFYNEIRDRASISTANRHLTLIKLIFNRSIALGLFNGENPANKVLKGKEPPNRLRYLSQVEMQKLLTLCDPAIYPIIVCALFTGMRRGEIMSLTWAHVNLQQRLIHIAQSKSGKSREIPIAPKLYDNLADMGQREPSERVFNVPNITLRRHFDKVLQTAGITGFRFHDLRHTFASYFIMKTGNLPALQKILGHSTPLMTQRYAHLSAGYLQTEMQAFNSCMPAIQEISVALGTKGYNLGTNDNGNTANIVELSMTTPM
ncbi:MAG: hypothetical protein A2270_03010 [Elusimicrobia bacterium RIFOXYA12_FULL_51_18]|nr:MAG: hypothetical protein A2270_03010 [Elusimicrobia bacterium RIFOXYA12_FULL_51_18]OGS28384.1 MAG: hypothetical protein A2218_06880 [Elusimicrobia bacterium RIFOXYA2_FULL_53_38]